MATYYDKAFDLASAEERFQVVRPWWDLLSQMTIQFSMIIALTSISLDVFSQFGSGIKCIAADVTKELGIQQYFWVNSACIEKAVSFYVEYFGYMMFLQCLILITIDNFWLNWARTKNRLKAFNDIVEEVHNSPVKRESITKSLSKTANVAAAAAGSGGEAAEEEEEKIIIEPNEEEEENVEVKLSALVSAQNQVNTAEAEEALRLNEQVRAFLKTNQESTLLANAYRTKTVLRLLFGLLFLSVSIFYIVVHVFDFDFPCSLSGDYFNVDQVRSLKSVDFYCINVTATFSRMLVFAFVFVIFINVVICVFALVGWGKVKKLISIEDDTHEIELEETSLQDIKAEYHVGHEMVKVEAKPKKAVCRTNDIVFLLHLLYQTDESIFNEFLNFADPDFHHELLEYLSNRAWPLEKLKSLVKPKPAMQSLKIVDANLVLIPPAMRHMSHSLVEIDVSSNNHLFNISNLVGQKSLKYLKIRGCNVRNIDCLMGIKTLVRLDVSNNKITRIPKEIVELKKLTYLLIKYNRIQVLPEEILHLPALNYLSVEGKLLDKIDSDHVFFEKHPYIRGVFIRRILVEPVAKDPEPKSQDAKADKKQDVDGQAVIEPEPEWQLDAKPVENKPVEQPKEP